MKPAINKKIVTVNVARSEAIPEPRLAGRMADKTIDEAAMAAFRAALSARLETSITIAALIQNDFGKCLIRGWVLQYENENERLRNSTDRWADTGCSLGNWNYNFKCLNFAKIFSLFAEVWLSKITASYILKITF